MVVLQKRGPIIEEVLLLVGQYTTSVLSSCGEMCSRVVHNHLFMDLWRITYCSRLSHLFCLHYTCIYLPRMNMALQSFMMNAWNNLVHKILCTYTCGTHSSSEHFAFFEERTPAES